MIPILSGLQYAPPVAFFASGIATNGILLEAHEHYQKRSWRNKTAIQHVDGITTLTIPLRKGKHESLPIREVEISFEENWQEQHLRSFKTIYGKSAFFEEVTDMLTQHFLKGHSHLWNFNYDLLQDILDLCRLNISITLTDSFHKEYVEPKLDFRKGIVPGENNSNSFDFPAYPQIQRIGRSFLPNLSILDVLFHLGPTAKDYLMECSKKR